MSQTPYEPVRPVSEPLAEPIPHLGETAGDRAAAAADSLAAPAADVKDAAVAAGQDLAATARTEVGQVAGEAGQQARALLDSSLGELRQQAGTAQAKLAETVRALADELGAMRTAPDAHGPLTDLAGSAQDLARRAADWMDGHEPGDALVQVRRYAARNPLAFLAIAGGAGLLVGRLTRNLRDVAADEAASGPARRTYAAGDPYRPEAFRAPGRADS